MEHLKTLIVGFILMIVLLVCINSIYFKQFEAIMAETNSTQQEVEDLRTEISSLTDAYETENASLTDAITELKEEIKQSTEEVTTEESTEEEEISTKEAEVTTTTRNTTVSETTEETDQTIVEEAVVFDEEYTNSQYPVEAEIVPIEGEIGDYEEPTTTYSGLSETDIYYLQRVAETETYGTDMMSKTHVVSVVLNRYNVGTWGNTVQAVVTSPNQFCYFRTSISQSSIDAVNYVLENGDTAQGALYFHSGAYSSTFCGRPFIFGDDCGHYFY